MGKGYIIELDSWPAFIIKQEVKKMSLDKVKQSASDIIEDFKQKAEMDEIINHRMEKLNISDDNQLFGFKLESADLKYNLFLDLQRLGSYNRKKGMWFTEEYWSRLKLLMIKYPNEHHKIMKSLRLPKSSFYRLIKEFKNDDNKRSAINRKMRSEMELTKQEKIYIQALVTPPTTPTTVDGIRSRVKNLSGRNPTRGSIISCLKTDLKYKYKRGSSRSILSKDKKLKYMQAIFGCRMLEAIYNEQYLINVDEASYSRSVKTAYSWLSCRKSNPIVNSRFQGSANIIFALWVDGEWMWLISNETTAIKFVRFMLLLRKFIEFVIWVDPTTIRIWLDNAPLHSSRIVKRAAHNLEMPLHFLSPYSPCLAPVEWIIGMSKRILSKGELRPAVNFSKTRGKMILLETFMNLSRNSAIRIWLRWIEEIRRIIKKCQDSLAVGFNILSWRDLPRENKLNE